MMTSGCFNDDQCRQLGRDVKELMESYAAASLNTPEGYSIDNASMEFYLGDSAGPIVGKWRVTVERLGLD